MPYTSEGGSKLNTKIPRSHLLRLLFLFLYEVESPTSLSFRHQLWPRWNLQHLIVDLLKTDFTALIMANSKSINVVTLKKI